MHWFSLVFLATLALATAARLWLSARRSGTSRGTATRCPPSSPVASRSAAHEKAADYNVAKARVGLIETLVAARADACVHLRRRIAVARRDLGARIPGGRLCHGIALIVSVILVSSAVDLPFSLYRTFVIEARFGFQPHDSPPVRPRHGQGRGDRNAAGNPSRPSGAVADGEDGRFLVARRMGRVGGVQPPRRDDFPTFIAPLFNKFSPLEDAGLRARIEALLAKCGFRSKGLFVMTAPSVRVTATPTSPVSVPPSASCSSTRWCRGSPGGG